ncbi:MAG: type II secretion system protein, partial [Planctomycetota bacterium]
FTLIELLVVMAIIGILVALVAGVSRYVMIDSAKKETIAIQSIVSQAIKTYRDSEGELPDVDASDDCGALMGRLSAVSASNRKLRNLPEDAWTSGSAPLMDGFDRPMKYDKDGGIGGTFVLISAGADGKFNGDPEKAEDNIRSDR